MGKWGKIVGFIIHLAVGGMMIFAGSGKVFGFAPPEIVKSMQEHGFGNKLVLIGSGEMIAAILLLIPWTSSLGVLATSGFWGGAIAVHLGHGEPFALQAGMLTATWVGALLRTPQTFHSFSSLFGKT